MKIGVIFQRSQIKAEEILESEPKPCKERTGTRFGRDVDPVHHGKRSDFARIARNFPTLYGTSLAKITPNSNKTMNPMIRRITLSQDTKLKLRNDSK